MAARINPKRSFLFVSKILGKHIPVNPYISLLGGMSLAARYLEEVYDICLPEMKDIIYSLKTGENAEKNYKKIKRNLFKLPEKTLFIGFAETATALGHSVFASFEGNGYYIHTTREIIDDFDNIIKFEEEHSHATSHRVYPLDFSFFKSNCPIVFVDDEITTGKTILNIIKSIHKDYPRKNYYVVTILDWRSDEDKKRFKSIEDMLGVNIKVISLISGNIEIIGQPIKSVERKEENQIDNIEKTEVEYIYLDSYFDEIYRYNDESYLKWTGRFGITLDLQRKIDNKIEEAGLFLRNICNGKKILCMGTEEFMYIPMMISAYIGEDVYYQSTTRSPIYPYDESEYGAKNAFSFVSPNNEKLKNYFYNAPYRYYDEIFLFLERYIEKDKLNSILKQLKRLGVRKIFVVMCTRN
ncbi:phosphoribosyltransferase family protein [Caminicella sporogenes]|uniref:phosphoribosyltransferase family protein n=1 Tax=Caminicella sporogenes TaxID=166485 RepID=UPI0025407D90|nr:phosphoribosyltransferase family protein [Caminicella sporogenes]WIF95267.1 phosphoribosyltransferase family protein [Caminicella sporogenes]